MNKKLQHIVSKSAMLLASLAFLLTLATGTASAHSTHIASPKIPHGVYLGGSTIYVGGNFDLSDGGGDYLLSPDHQYQLIFQSDGNLVEYDLWNGGAVVWASNTTYSQTCAGCGQGVTANMQQDGNFVIYDNHGNALFATNTYYRDYRQYAPNYYSHYYSQGYDITIQDDSNVVVYDQDAHALWAIF